MKKNIDTGPARMDLLQSLTGLLLLLSSDHSRFINGAVIAADDGFGL